jgi:two-component system nitrate/nitrite response regulator NarL
VGKGAPLSSGADEGLSSAAAQNTAQYRGETNGAAGPAASEKPKEGVLRVLIVDEHQVFGDGIQAILRQQGIEVVGIARNPEQTFSAVSLGLPDVVLLCVWAKSILAESRTARALSALTSADRAGLADRQPRSSRVERQPTREERFAPEDADGYVALDRRRNGDQNPSEEKIARLAGYLTPRERQVLGLLMEGASNKDMARRLSIRSNTVRTHVQNVLTKLQVHTRLGAVTFAVRQGVTSSASLNVPPANGASHPPMSVI